MDSGAAVGFADVAVLYRLKSQRPLLEAALAQAGIPFTVVGEEPALLRGKGRVDGKATAYVCHGMTCSAPVTRAEDLAALLVPAR